MHISNFKAGDIITRHDPELCYGGSKCTYYGFVNNCYYILSNKDNRITPYVLNSVYYEEWDYYVEPTIPNNNIEKFFTNIGKIIQTIIPL